MAQQLPVLVGKVKFVKRFFRRFQEAAVDVRIDRRRNQQAGDTGLRGVHRRSVLRWTGRPAATRWWPTWGGPSGTGRRLDETTRAPRLWAFGLRTRPLSRQSTPPRRPPPAVFPLPPQPGLLPLTGRRRQPSTTVSDRPRSVSATRARRSSAGSTGSCSAPLCARTR